MENNIKQVVQPEVSRKKFDDELEEFRKIENEWRLKGVICVKAEYPTIQFIFIAHSLKPSVVAFAVSIDFVNYDVDPPSVVFIDPFTLKPLTTKEMQVGFFQVQNQIQNVPTPQGIKQVQMQLPVPILMSGLNDTPFLCIPGVREYHNHPAHTDNPWLNYRTRGEGKLCFLLDQLYNHCIPHISGLNINFIFSLKQF